MSDSGITKEQIDFYLFIHWEIYGEEDVLVHYDILYKLSMDEKWW